ncbi:MAG: Holliday junction resolvase RuvX [Rhodanobacteraceae bacterium]
MSAQARRFLGFDLGTRLTGVAVGENLTGNARPLTTLGMRNAVPDWDAVAQLVAQWQPAALVVGLPLALDGSEQSMSRRARRFAAELDKRFDCPVHLCDERHTSQEAARRFARARSVGSKRRRHAADLDAMAAAVILESWFSLNPADATPRHD